MSTKATQVSTGDFAKGYLRAAMVSTLLNLGEPAALKDIAARFHVPGSDMTVIRYTLVSNSQLFVQSDRKWGLSIGFEDSSRPMTYLLDHLLQFCGQPVRLNAVIIPMAKVYQRPADILAESMQRLIGNYYFHTSDGRVGIKDWLFQVDQDGTDEDMAFTNFVDYAAAEKMRSKKAKIRYDGTDESVLALLDAAEGPVSVRTLAYLNWRHDPKAFNSLACFEHLMSIQGAVVIPAFEPGCDVSVPHLASNELAASWIDSLKPEMDAVNAQMAEQMAEPLALSEEGVGTIIAYINQQGSVVDASEIVTNLYERTSIDSTYKQDIKTVCRVLQASDGVLWVGGSRFAPETIFPVYTDSIPDSLTFPVVHFYDEDSGEELEVDLKDEGFLGTLKSDIMDPVVLDVLDEENDEYIIVPEPTTISCVLKMRHKELGTFPLCQIPKGFFAGGPQKQLLTFIDGQTEKWYDIYLNHTTRLLYGLFEFYMQREAPSGATFEISKTETTGVYRLNWTDAIDSRVHLSQNRVEALYSYAANIHGEATFDVICKVLTDNRRGLEFAGVLAEVNVIRQTTRRRVASVLSAFPAFYQRGGMWHLDESKRDQGIDKARRKYIIK